MAYQDPGSAIYSNYASQFYLDSALSSEAQQMDSGPINPVSEPAVPDDSFAYAYDNSTYASLFDDATQFLQQDIQPPFIYDPFYTGLQTLNSSQCPPDYKTYSTQQTPDIFPIQYPPNPPQYTQTSTPSHITKQRSKELVGMGLYDGPGRKELSGLNASPVHISDLLAPPQGKGLKLEETWQPPNTNSDDAEEENYSTDEAEDDLPPAPGSADAQSTFIPAYGDLSNQSFFFDTDDSYSNCMLFDQGIQLCQPKASDPSNQNFMWL